MCMEVSCGNFMFSTVQVIALSLKSQASVKYRRYEPAGRVSKVYKSLKSAERVSVLCPSALVIYLVLTVSLVMEFTSTKLYGILPSVIFSWIRPVFLQGTVGLLPLDQLLVAVLAKMATVGTVYEPTTSMISS